MITKISGEQPFQVLTSAFSISPSQSGYNLEISADGVNYSPLFTVGAGVTRLVTGVAANSYYRLAGNTSAVVINWQKSCSDGGSGGGNAGQLEPVTEFPLSPVEGAVVALASGDTVGVYQYDGSDWVAVGVDDLSDYYTKAETDAQITAATSPIQEQLDDVERVTASALTELHQDILDLSGATPDLSNYYTKQETDTQIADAIADISQPDLSNYYTKDQIGIKEEVVSRALNDLHEDILDLSGATPDLSNYWTSAQTQDAIDEAISGATPTNSPIIPAITSQAEYEAISGDVQTGDLIQVQGVDINDDGEDEYGLFEASVDQGSISWGRKDNAESLSWADENFPWMKNNVHPIEFLGNGFFVSFDLTAEGPAAYNGIGFDADGKPVITHIVPQIVEQTGEITGMTREDRAIVAGEGINRIMKLTQAEYDAITTPDASTLYIIVNN